MNTDRLRKPSQPMKQFRCTWVIDAYADTPQQAAEIALAYQRDSESSATVFEVAEFPPAGPPITVDLGYCPNPAVDLPLEAD